MCDDIIDTLTNHNTVSKQDCPLLSWWVTLPAVAASPNGLHYRIASTISISYLSWWFALPAVAASPDGLHYQQWLPDFWTAVVISPVHQNLDVERVICHKTPHPVCDVLEYYASLWHYTHLTFAIRNIWILGCFHDTLKKVKALFRLDIFLSSRWGKPFYLFIREVILVLTRATPTPLDRDIGSSVQWARPAPYRSTKCLAPPYGWPVRQWGTSFIVEREIIKMN